MLELDKILMFIGIRTSPYMEHCTAGNNLSIEQLIRIQMSDEIRRGQTRSDFYPLCPIMAADVQGQSMECAYVNLIRQR